MEFQNNLPILLGFNSGEKYGRTNNANNKLISGSAMNAVLKCYKQKKKKKLFKPSLENKCQMHIQDGTPHSVTHTWESKSF